MLIGDAGDVELDFLLLQLAGFGKQIALLRFRRFFPKLLGIRNGAADFFLNLEQRAGLARQLHFIEDGFEQLQKHAAFRRREFLVHKLAQQFLLTGHRLGADDVRAGDARAFRRFEVHGLPCILRPQPEGQPGDLRGPGINVNAVDVVLDDEAGHLAKKFFLGRKGLAQRFHPRRTNESIGTEFFLQLPSFAVNDWACFDKVDGEVGSFG